MGSACSALNCNRSIKVANLSPGRLDDKYDLRSDMLGKGSFATVQTACERATGKLCACKIIRKYLNVPSGHPDYGQPAIDPEYLNIEIEILRKAGSHPNILEVYDVYGAPAPAHSPARARARSDRDALALRSRRTRAPIAMHSRAAVGYARGCAPRSLARVCTRGLAVAAQRRRRVCTSCSSWRRAAACST
jgi:hypothetical protein